MLDYIIKRLVSNFVLIVGIITLVYASYFTYDSTYISYAYEIYNKKVRLGC